jgi:hypothetical protein
MGQQQLLLIVLGVIVVGIAVVVGINLFNANAESSTQDSITSEGTNLGAMAQQFYKKPVAMGGGGNSFSTNSGAPTAWTVPAQLDTTSDAVFTAAVNDQDVVITGTPIDAGYSWHVETTVTPTSIVSEVK